MAFADLITAITLAQDLTNRLAQLDGQDAELSARLAAVRSETAQKRPALNQALAAVKSAAARLT